MRKQAYTEQQKRQLKKKFTKITQEDMIEVSKECNVSYATVRVVKNMHGVSAKVIHALLIKSIKYEKAKNRK